MKTWMMAAVAALALLGVPVSTTQAAEIVVYLNQATESGVKELAAGFEKASGHKVNVSFQGGPNLNQKINEGTTGDVTSPTPAVRRLREERQGRCRERG
jgi:ABC-type molybdate transport system substrate-binding protein